MNLIEIRVLDRINDNIGLSTSEDVINYCRNKPLEMQTMAQEVLYCFCLDIKNKINSAELISKGNLTTSIVHPREVLKAAVLSNSASIILAHNHPSGDPSPSMDDTSVTEKINKACKIMGINFLDHVIIGRDSNYSFRKNCEYIFS